MIKQETTYYFPGGSITHTHYTCCCSGGTCLPTYTVTPSTGAEYDDFNDAVKNDDIVDYFRSSDYDDIFPGLDSIPGVVDSLTNGIYTIDKWNNDSINNPEVMFVVYPVSVPADSTNYDKEYKVALPVIE